MPASEDLINFDVIETQKENIQSLPGGRSAKALAQIFSSGSNGDRYVSPSPNETRTLNDAVRQEYEAEIEASADSDDPLDVYDRYVKWTLNAYPSAQATAESGLLPLLERATKAFLNSTHYRNDPRYLRLWLQYIRLFSDAPRETFAFLSRHNIGQGLALFYEEFAAWLEGAGRWAQAEEVYKLGLQREARPQERLLRKFDEFQTRFGQLPQGSDGPSSPALPSVRPALAAKIDPFSTAQTPPVDPQAPQPRGIGGSGATKPGKPKMAIFSDSSDTASQPPVSGQSAGWDSIQSIRERRKENTVEAKPWVGETLKSEKQRAPVQKMAIFRDKSNPNTQNESNIPSVPKETPEHHIREAVNPRTGRRERVFVNLQAVYPDYENPSFEICLEELRAAHRGWLKKDWRKPNKALQEIPTNAAGRVSERPDEISDNIENALVDSLNQKLAIDRKSGEPREGKLSKVKKIKMREVNETQTVKTNLDSPTGPKIKRRNVSEPTMTFHTRAATDEIYSIFNQPLQSETADGNHGDSLFDSEYEDDDYTSVADSTGTGRMSAGTSEFGDDDTSTLRRGNDEEEDMTNDGEWTEFTVSKHIPTASIDGQNVDENVPESAKERYIPEMPENYNPPVGMYRDAAIMAQNRLPFMTPIIEQTESSLASYTAAKSRLYDTKTPCKTVLEVDYTPKDSPVGDLLLLTPDPEAVNTNLQEIQSPSPAVKTELRRTPVKKVSSQSTTNFECIIRDEQCDPTDKGIRSKILNSIEPPLASFGGFYNHSSVFGSNAGDILKYSKSLKKPVKGADKLPTPVLGFPNAKRTYAIRRELGAGAYAPVYLAESVEDIDSYLSDSEDESGRKPSPVEIARRQNFEAIKMETDPPNAWEFYMIRIAHDRMATSPSLSRATESIVKAHELHLFKDESFLVEDYRGQGTLLDLVNIIRTEAITNTGNSDAGMDEALAMFFSVELFRTIEALHACGILHGDVKPDNCLVRLDEIKNRSSSLPSPPGEPLFDLAEEDAMADPNEIHYSSRGLCGWRQRGLMLIDFGRGIDMKAFRPDVQFIADWEMSQHDCIEVREMRPWTYQIDLYGVAVTIHAMLFGKYLECVPADSRNSGGRDSFNNNNNETHGQQSITDIKRYRIRESFKRYWDRAIWSDVFDLLLNPCTDRWTQMEQQNASTTTTNSPSSHLPVLNSMKHIRERMEAWLAINAEKKGLSLQIRKLEAHLSRRKERLEKEI
ncbi:putative checkpoint protein kinase [Talaromyces proteolyticus]|uniref:Checkpoint protein kinase n=1 Tax=Talaromyces proteolyticus TaxID=1131652 RepID=A0AAD4PZV3_9EURO|nr:putative checkpoint protein kinase [Talaromyces proteolyticus]KAH8696263.1 putative checkpoint protein kinase [Talaromyces proteolyticus]